MQRLETRREKQKRIEAGRRNKKLILLVALAVVSVLAIVFAIDGASLLEKKREKSRQAEELTVQVNEQKQRSEDLKNEESYMQTDEYVIKIAREKLGLLFKDEMVFKRKKK